MRTIVKKYVITVFVLLIGCLIVVWHSFSRGSLQQHISFSQAVYSEDQKLLRLTLSHDDKYRLFTPLEKIPPQLVEAVLLHEDQYFYWHPGINPVALTKAAWKTYICHTRRFGASTITMQLARIIYGVNSKTVSGKILQIFYAGKLELLHSKKQIIEAYLNLAPYGGNIEGVGAASLIYFGKTPDKLTLNEMLALAVIPQSPIRHINPNTLKLMRAALFSRWLLIHPEDKNKQATFTIPLTLQSIKQLPFLAPHFVNTILAEAKTEDGIISTTLNFRWQHLTNRVMQNYLARTASLGINNAAVMLVDSRDMKIKVLLGSSGFFNRAISGQINGTQTKRSPGSTLKPFIYALALDQGLIHPATILKDVPQSFGNYNPENFDNDFVGPIKARDALILSRNIPAIFLASKLENPSLFQFLELANISGLKPESAYGLTLALGGAEVSMQELVALYASLANVGVWHPLRNRNDQQLVFGKRLLSPEASFLVLDMLEKTEQPQTVLFAYNKKQNPVAWKTGTSAGFRDAWTIGVFGPYVLAVWIGNFDSSSNHAFIGREIAAPLFFEILNSLTSQFNDLELARSYPAKLQLTKVAVCKASGLLPTRYCRDTELTWFIPGKSPITTDNVFREVAIDKNSGRRTCHFDNNTRFEVYEFWSSDFLKIFKRAGIERRTPPPYDDSCNNSDTTQSTQSGIGMAPQITSPQAEVSYTLRLDTKENSIIPLTATVDADVANLYWFVDQSYLGKTNRDQPLLWNAKLGKFTIRVIDDRGRSDARDLEVRTVSQ